MSSAAQNHGNGLYLPVTLSSPLVGVVMCCDCNVTGRRIEKSQGLNELLHIPNSARVINVKDPKPGMWAIKVNESFPLV